MDRVREVFETNTFGVMATTQAVLPQFRERGSGVVINVTSSVVLGHMPLSAVYKASKMAVEGFTASLSLELAPFGVQAKTVEPGACLTTNFAARATNGTSVDELVPAPYAAWAKKTMDSFTGQDQFTKESDVAETVWRAAHDTTGQLRFPAGPDAGLARPGEVTDQRRTHAESRPCACARGRLGRAAKLPGRPAYRAMCRCQPSSGVSRSEMLLMQYRWSVGVA